MAARRRLLVLSVAFCALGAVERILANPPRVPQGSRASDLFLVMPFEQSTRDARFTWIGEGLGELFSERLAADDRLVFPRSEWLAALEKLGLPPSTRFTRATTLKIAQQIDADYVIYGRYATDGKRVSVTTYLLQVSPPAISPAFTEAGALEDLMDVQARAGWHAMRFADSLYPANQAAYVQKFRRYRIDAFEQYVRGLLAADEQRVRNFREAARLDPDWVDPAFALGETYFAARNCEPALIWLSRVPPNHPRGLDAGFLSGVCHLLRNDAPRAEAAFAGVLSGLARAYPRAQGPPEALNNLAMALSRQGKHGEAGEQWQLAQQLDPEQPDYWFNAALGLFRAEEFSAAVRPLRELLKRNPEDGDARSLLLMALERAGRATEAAAAREQCPSETCGASAAVQAVLRAPPDAARNPAMDRFTRVERISMGLDVSALLLANRTAQEGPGSSPGKDHYEIHLARGRKALAEGKTEEAARDFSEAVVLAPESPEPRIALADAYEKLGRGDDAIRELRAALWGRENAGVRVCLARIYISRGQAGEARTELRTALRAEPNHAEARRLLDSLSAAAGAPR